MEPIITIPQSWEQPQYGFGQRTEIGVIIGMKYFGEDTFLGNEYGAGWRYILMPSKHDEDEEHRTEDQIKLLSPQELKTVLEAEINNHLRQAASLKHQLESIPVSVVIPNLTVETEPQTDTQGTSSANLQDLINGAKLILKEISKHPDYLSLDYHPDLTIGDAQTALSYLECELESSKDKD